MTLFDTVFRTSRAERILEPRSNTFAPELLLMLFLVFVPILSIHMVAWIIDPPVAAGSAPSRLAGGDSRQGG
jgi:hypothetical protein